MRKYNNLQEWKERKIPLNVEQAKAGLLHWNNGYEGKAMGKMEQKGMKVLLKRLMRQTRTRLMNSLELA